MNDNELRQKAEHYGMEFVNLNRFKIPKEVANIVSWEICKRNKIIPIGIINDGVVKVAMSNPDNFPVMDMLNYIYPERTFEFCVSDEESIKTLIFIEQMKE